MSRPHHSYLSIRQFLANESDKEKRLKFLFGQKENLKKLIQENKQRFIKNMDGEYKTFKRYFKI